MARMVEGNPGEEAEVWIQDRGSSTSALRGTVVIEDLADVVTCIKSRTGPNGPQNPVTQYILAKAAEYLAERLTEDGCEGHELAPRTLSGALGHQPFIESVLNMSHHQMLRRWPLATDWYQDVINYVMRPSRFDLKAGESLRVLEEWTQGTFGTFVQKFSEAVLLSGEDPKMQRVAEALQSLWPDYPPVRNAMLVYRRQVDEIWVPLYDVAMRTYGLRHRPGVTVADLAWAFNSLQARESWERLGDPSMANRTAPDGSPWSHSASAGLMLICGAVTDEEGRLFTLEELSNRRPVVPA